METLTVLTGHVSEETAFLIDDYPCGFTKRCKKRVWIETAAKGAKKGLSRLVEQTTKPLQEGVPISWNKEKSSTYDSYILLYIDPGTKHVRSDGLSQYPSLKEVVDFKQKWWELMPEEEKSNFVLVFTPERLAAMEKMESLRWVITRE